MRRRSGRVVLAVGYLAIGCSSNEPENGGTREVTLSDCAVETVIEHLIENRSAVDCGHIGPSSSSDAVLAANRCAADSHAATRPFWLTIEGVGIDSLISTSYVGTVIDGRFVVLIVHYDSLGVEPNGANVRWYTCTSFEIDAACEPGDGGPSSQVSQCITCTTDYRDSCECSPSTRRVSCGRASE
jgi:hypothetical protein